MTLFSFFSRRNPQPRFVRGRPPGGSAFSPSPKDEIPAKVSINPTSGEPDWEICWEQTIASRIEEGKIVLDEVLRQLEALQWNESDLFSVRLALEEALVNAIKHGNSMDPNKRVTVICQIRENSLRIEIEDEGEGFCLSDVPDPTDEANLDRPCGRGIMLMRAFLSFVEYNEMGNKVVLEKIRSEVSKAPPESESA